MDTPTISAYYRESDPLKRKELLTQSIEAGEDTENNKIRKELWEIRYREPAQTGNSTRADGYLGLWMAMEFNRNTSGKLFGSRGARKEITKHLEKLKFSEFSARSQQHQELLYRECCHMVKTYMELCAKDRNYNTVLCGIINMSSDRSKEKLQRDIYETAVLVPRDIGMEQELALITRAAREMYEQQFPGEGGMAE
ncbi:MAG: hypothetical protein Q4C91_14315 [Eubacteriales bacterium]|nr:hypothetical protein [Eubacteriales bacterium]